MIEKKRLALGFGLALAIIIADRLTKHWIVEVLDLPTRFRIEVTSFFNLTMVWNRGVSFGMFGDDGVSAYVLGGFAIAVSIGLAIWMVRSKDLFLTVTLGLIIGGALGNAWDRWIYGAVADFFDFHVLGWHFWAFNIADSAISIGVALLLWDSVFGSGSKTAKD
ncbi:MAG: signal peptidase II [Alphaproteobacteria bacterium]